MQPASGTPSPRPEWDKLRQELLRKIVDHELRKRSRLEGAAK